ncbi:MAG: apolipoprotein N-acyltransferase [Candidatus Bipolaricaulaceae bacterium]
MTSKIRYLAPAVSAATLWAAFFPGWGWLAWLAPAGLLWAVDGAGLRRGLLLGALFGVVFFSLELSFVWELRSLVGGLAAAAWALLVCFGALYFAAFGGLGGWRGGPAMWAGAWAGMEALRSLGPLGFTLGSVPGALAGQPFLPAAAWGGPWLLSLAAAWTAGCLARGVRSRRWLAVSPLGPLALLGLALAHPSLPTTGELQVAAVQPGIPQEEKLDPDYVPRHLALYRDLLGTVGREAELVVLPENAISGFLAEDPEAMLPFTGAARRLQATLLVGSGYREGDEVYNSVLMIGSQGGLGEVYHMSHLVPFGEYLPGRRFWEAWGMEDLLEEWLPRPFTPGGRPRPLGPYGVLICFETQFPGLARQLVRQGAQLLVAATNDAWFGGARVLEEHFALGALRAAESGRAFVQAAQTGVTGAWGPRGRLLARGAAQGAQVVTVTVPLVSGLTPYNRLGDLPVVAAMGLLMVWGAMRTGGPRR